MEDRYIETQKTWNNIAQLYEDKFMKLDLYNDTYKSFCDLLVKPDASLLEMGCGPGNITRHLLDRMPNLNILATDVAENMIELAKRNNPEVKTQLLDGRNLTSLNSNFDGIIGGFILPYLSKVDCAQLIADCSELLNKEGVLYLSFVPGDIEQTGYVTGSNGNRTYFYYHDLKWIKQQLALNKLTVVDCLEKEYKKTAAVVETHVIITAKKQVLE